MKPSSRKSRAKRQARRMRQKARKANPVLRDMDQDDDWQEPVYVDFSPAARWWLLIVGVVLAVLFVRGLFARFYMPEGKFTTLVIGELIVATVLVLGFVVVGLKCRWPMLRPNPELTFNTRSVRWQFGIFVYPFMVLWGIHSLVAGNLLDLYHHSLSEPALMVMTIKSVNDPFRGDADDCYQKLRFEEVTQIWENGMCVTSPGLAQTVKPGELIILKGEASTVGFLPDSSEIRVCERISQAVPMADIRYACH